MSDQQNHSDLKKDMSVIIIIASAMFMMLPVYLMLCLILGDEIRLGPNLEPPIVLRTVFYAIAIATFPLANLLRHIMLRLNHTMPGDTPARSRYLSSVLVSLGLAESIAILGFILFLLGDNFTTLIIFILLSALAMFLYRPKFAEYQSIVMTLQERPQS